MTAPGDAWRELVEGNTRFIAGAPQHPRQDVEHRELLASGQRPRAALLGCSDSRLAAEIIFDLGLGDLFAVRNAGQVVSESAIGSLEYAVAVLGVPLIVVLGHDSCGAVRAAIDSHAADAAPLPPHIRSIVNRIEPAVRAIGGADPDPATIDAGEVGREHVRGTIRSLLDASELLSDAVAAGTLAIVGGTYRLAEGRVDADVTVGSL